LHDAVTKHRNTRTSFGKAGKLKRETEDRFARRNLLVPDFDIGVLAEIARASLCDDKPAAFESEGDSATGIRTVGLVGMY
jgi:hypothetical protein